MTRTHRITHTTVYGYDDLVSASYGRAWLRPRELPWQRCTAHDVTVRPAPVDLSVGEDVYGNQSAYFQVATPHDTLTVTAVSLVDVDAPPVPAAAHQPWEACRAGGAVDRQVVDTVLDRRPAEVLRVVTEFAAGSFVAGRSLLDAVLHLQHRIHSEFTYSTGSTTIESGLADVLAQREGVCQDFARLATASLRSLGLACRYVSGYLATDPPAGRERMVGIDATHAWAAVWVPDGTAAGDWLAFDPTNDQLVDDRYTTVAWGRDYADVPPLRGVVFTDAKKSTMDVSVDVAPA